MHFTSPSRRVFGILAAGTIGLSTALLGVTGVAQAAPGDTTVTTDTAATDPAPAVVLAAPYAPTMIDVQGDDTTLGVWFDETPGDDTTDWADTWEYSLDGGSWVATTPDWGSGYGYFEVTGLTNGTAYAVRVRGVSAAPANGTASDPMSGTPYKPIGAPASPVVTVGPSSLKISWAAPTVNGTYGLASYVVLADLDAAPGAQSGGPTTICETNASTTSCTAAVKAGRAYHVEVHALDTEGHGDADGAPITSAVVPAPTAPATVPTKNGDLTLPAGATSTVAAGKTMTISGSGYAPNSTITLAIYSTPQVLTTVVTDASGNFTATVTVPAGLEAGNHTLVASGVDSSGNVRYVNLAVTVSSTGKATLAYTGTDVTVPAIGGLAALALGAGLIVVRRRATRSAA